MTFVTMAKAINLHYFRLGNWRLFRGARLSEYPTPSPSMLRESSSIQCIRLLLTKHGSKRNGGDGDSGGDGDGDGDNNNQNNNQLNAEAK